MKVDCTVLTVVMKVPEVPRKACITYDVAPNSMTSLSDMHKYIPGNS